MASYRTSNPTILTLEFTLVIKFRPNLAVVTSRFLYFDIGTLYKAIGDYFYPKLMFGKELDPEREQKIKDALKFLEVFLGDQNFLTGLEPTVADLSISCSLSMLEVRRQF